MMSKELQTADLAGNPGFMHFSKAPKEGAGKRFCFAAPSFNFSKSIYVKAGGRKGLSAPRLIDYLMLSVLFEIL